MKLKTILITSLVANAVLLGTVAYMDSLSLEPQKVPPIIYYVTKGDSESIQTALKAAAGSQAVTP